jgi:hypothetical protein
MRGIFFVFLPVLIMILLGDPSGYALSAPRNILVNESIPGGQHLPSIALGPSNQIYIVWVDCRNDPTCETNTDIYFAKSTDGGQSFDPARLVSDNETFFANAPKVAADSSGNIYVVWHDNRAGDDSWDVYLSKSDNGGASFYPSVQVNDYISGVDQYEPDLALDSSGNIYVSWNRHYYDADLEQWDYDVYMAKSTDGGATFGTNVKVNDGSDWQYKSSIKVGNSGNVYVTWTDRRNVGISDVYFAKSVDGGSTFPTNTRINQYTEQSQGYPEMALDGDEVIYVVWNDSRNLYKKNGRDVFMARSLDSGDSFEPEIKINDAKIPAEFEYFYPTITAWGKGHVAIAWEDKREGNWDVYLTRSDNGGLSFRPSWRLNSAEKGSQSVPDIAMDAMGHVHCVWRDNRTGESQIYFARDESVKSVVKLLYPNGGEAISTGEKVPIEWDALEQAVSFDLYYSVDEGSTWKPINDTELTGYVYNWTVPPQNGNKKACFVKVVGFSSEGNQVGADKSDKPFTIQEVKVTYPSDPGISLTSGIEKTIQWEVSPTKSELEKIKLYYTVDGGATWKLIVDDLEANDRSYLWTPDEPKERKKCKVKVVLKDIMGNTIGIDSSDNYFAIELP